MIDMGADAVVCCHTHCPLPWEQYAGRPIFYSLGNLIFEAARMQPEAWYKGYLASLTIDEENIGFEAIPYYQSLASLGAQKMNENDKKNFFTEMQMKSIQIIDREFQKDQWLKHCRQQKELYLSTLFAYNRPMHKLRKFFLSTLHPKKAILRALMMVECETHREILNTIFRDI